MPMDKREMVLTRLVTILQGVDGFVNVWRDREAGQPKDPATQAPLLPAAIVLDGKEIVGIPGRHANIPKPFTLMPQVWIILMPRDTIANEGAGQELSAFRGKVIKAIINDEDLT